MKRRAFLGLGGALLLVAACGQSERVLIAENRPPPGQRPSVARHAGSPVPRVDDGRLQADLDAFLKEQRGNFGVSIRDLEGPVNASFEADDRFPLGSLFKLTLMAEVLRQVKLGKLSLGKSIQTLSDYDFGEPPGGVPPGSRLTVEEALAPMIAVSSNAAALALIEVVGPEALSGAPGRFGMGDTAIDVRSAGGPGRYEIDARGSARDVAALLVKLDREYLVGPEQDRKMIDLLLAQKIADRIPVLLPADVPIAHKTADLDGFTHDAGIVYLPGRPFAISVLAQGLSPTDGKASVSEIARIAFAYFSRAR